MNLHIAQHVHTKFHSESLGPRLDTLVPRRASVAGEMLLEVHSTTSCITVLA